MIHKSEVYFHVLSPVLKKVVPLSKSQGEMQHGELYIHFNKLYLSDNKRKKHWYKANIRDIKDIKTLLSGKQLLIRFWNFNIVLTCKNPSHLRALRDFLCLSQNYFLARNYPQMGACGTGGCSVH